ncbi:MAG: FKBP-type peptidyl-prolyl cis-trans isomerase [Bacteroidaceae bacterium]|nr:FKBP-type peptidyl-prolyl cis-trans isomerase [Bacteroidaceae bacterium]
MKKFFLTAAFSLFAAFVISCGNNKSVGVISKGDSAKFDTLSYVLGMDITYGLQRDLGRLKLDYNLVKNAIETASLSGDVVKSGGKDISSETYTDILNDFFMTKYRERMQTLSAIEAAKNDTTGTVPQINPDTLDFDVTTMFASNDECSAVSSALGYDLGLKLSKNLFPIQLVWLFEAVDDVLKEECKLTNEQAGNYMRHYFTVTLPAENKKASEEWLAEIEKQSGVKKTASGLLYRIVEEGDVATKPTAADEVKVHYKGMLRSGKVFDASRFADMPAERQEMLKMYRPDNYMDDEPVGFPLANVIKGWTEGMQLVGKGGKIELWIPGELAYGVNGAPRAGIGPNEALFFVVDLLEVVKAAPEPAAPEAPAK